MLCVYRSTGAMTPRLRRPGLNTELKPELRDGKGKLSVAADMVDILDEGIELDWDVVNGAMIDQGLARGCAVACCFVYHLCDGA